MHQEIRRIRLFGIDIAALTAKLAVGVIETSIEKKEQTHIGVVNAAKIVKMNSDSLLRNDVFASDLIFADGMSVVWASRLLRRPLPERVTGIDLMMSILEAGDEKNFRIYCLGATEAVSKRVADRIAADYPGVLLVGRHHGYFDEDGEKKIAEDIASSRADVLFVAMTSPFKERFLAKWRDTLGVTVYHGVGGSFDVFSGLTRRAPEFWQRNGLEWLYRVLQEPRRLWRRYLVTNVKFCGMVFREIFVNRPV